jgi:hypothetical protein
MQVAIAVYRKNPSTDIALTSKSMENRYIWVLFIANDKLRLRTTTQFTNTKQLEYFIEMN